MNKIYIDCSRTYIFGGNTGVQRVVRNISNILSGKRYRNYEIRPVVLSCGRYFEVDSIKNKNDSLLRFFKQSRKLFFTRIDREKKTSFKKNNYIFRKYFYNFFAIPIILSKKQVHFEKSDILFVTEHFSMMTHKSLLLSLKERGIKIGFLCYDLIPISHPQYYPEEDVVNFKINLSNSLEISDFCMAISDFTRKDLEKYIKENHFNQRIKIDNFQLGYDDNYNHNDTEKINKFNDVFFSNNVNIISTHIIVSTIEPRKNHSYLLDAFEKIWSTGIKSNLVIIGNVGWMCDEVLARIKNHEQYGKQLFMFKNISDTELNYCYKNAKALISPSIVEGFGLPIVEALAHKTPVLASDIPVFREVGGDFCTYFDLKDSSSLADIIIKWEKTGQEPQHRNLAEFKWPTWKESTEELITKIIELNNL